MDLKRKILVVDDDQSVCDLIAQTLKSRGYEVFTETRAREGVREAVEVLPDLVFMSLLLDTTNGLKVSKELHAIETLRKVPIVMLISYAGELDPKYTITIGVVDVLVKPLSERDILLKTEAVLGPVTPQDRAVEGVTPEMPDSENTGKAFEQEEGNVFDTSEETEEEIWELDDARDMQETPGGEIQQRQEPFQEAGNASSGTEEISEGLLAESGVGRTAGRIADEQGEEETDSESMQEEDQARSQDLERRGEAGVDLPTRTEKSGDRKRILVFGAALAVVMLIGMGTYLGLQFFPVGGDRGVVAPPVQKAPVTVSQDSQKTGTGALSETARQETMPQEIQVRPDAAKEKNADAAPKENASVKEVKADERDKGMFFVQVGFFANPKNAESLTEKMRQKGYKAFIKKEQAAGGAISCRVIVGKFRSRGEALEQAEVVLREEGIKPVLYKE